MSKEWRLHYTHVHSGSSDMCLQRGRPISKWTAQGEQTWYEVLVPFSIRCADAARVDIKRPTIGSEVGWPTALQPLTPSSPVCLRHRARVTVAARCSPWAALLWMHQLIWHAAGRPHTNWNRTVHTSDSPIFWCVPILPISDLRIGLTLLKLSLCQFMSDFDETIWTIWRQLFTKLQSGFWIFA